MRARALARSQTNSASPWGRRNYGADNIKCTPSSTPECVLSRAHTFAAPHTLCACTRSPNGDFIQIAAAAVAAASHRRRPGPILESTNNLHSHVRRSCIQIVFSANQMGPCICYERTRTRANVVHALEKKKTKKRIVRPARRMTKLRLPVSSSTFARRVTSSKCMAITFWFASGPISARTHRRQFGRTHARIIVVITTAIIISSQ